MSSNIVFGTLKTDGTLELDQKPNLSAGRVRVTVEKEANAIQPIRFWTMMEQIWGDLSAAGHVPRSVEQVEAERAAFREEWDATTPDGEKVQAEIE